MNNKRQRLCGLLLSTVLIASAIAQTAPATRPKFTISKETTLVDGPLRADGTIDYIPAINKLIGGDIKSETNAAIPLLLLSFRIIGTNDFDDRTKDTFTALHVPVPEKSDPPARYFSDYLAHKSGTEGKLPNADDSVRMAEMEEQARQHPWKTADRPDLVEWLKASEPGLKIVEEACNRQNFYLPFEENAKSTVVPPGSAMAGMPDVGILFLPKELLLTRAMFRAGEGDLKGAYEDLRRVRSLARLGEREHMNLQHLTDLAIETDAMRAYAGIANSGLLNAEQLGQLRKEIEAMPQLVEDDKARTQVEEMFGLDVMMICIHGESESIMRLMAGDFSMTTQIDLGDWRDADWDAALRETVRVFSPIQNENTFVHRVQDLNTRREEEKTDSGPNWLEAITAGGAEPLTARVEKFLKIREGETREQFATRIAHWLCGANAADRLRMISLDERPRMLRALALTAISLAEFKLAHNEYPEYLEKLPIKPALDSFTDKPLLYKRDAKGYILWSVGMNQQDDGGTKDDLVIKSDGN